MMISEALFYEFSVKTVRKLALTGLKSGVTIWDPTQIP